MNLNDKYEKLKQIFIAEKKAAVAFSGGVDSSFLCRVAHDCLGDNAVAITIVSPMLPQSEINDAASLAIAVGIRHILVEDREIEPSVAENPPDRCYQCKKKEYGSIMQRAREEGIDTVFDGSNVDDLSDYRPGARALKELAVRSPLREAGLTKNEIRELSKMLCLPTWDKPAFACLASRIPYGETITEEKLSRVEKAEDFLRSLGFRQFRVRSHDNLARIEVATSERVKLFSTDIMDAISAELKSLGFIYVCAELSGYETGSLNRTLTAESLTK